MTAATATVANGWRNQTVTIRRPMRTAAETMRIMGGCGLRAAGCGRRTACSQLPAARRRSPLPCRRRFGGDRAVAAFALLIIDHRIEQVPGTKVGPERLGDPDLRIGDLPQEKIADAHLAACADQ